MGPHFSWSQECDLPLELGSLSGAWLLPLSLMMASSSWSWRTVAYCWPTGVGAPAGRTSCSSHSHWAAPWPGSRPQILLRLQVVMICSHLEQLDLPIYFEFLKHGKDRMQSGPGLGTLQGACGGSGMGQVASMSYRYISVSSDRCIHLCNNSPVKI